MGRQRPDRNGDVALGIPGRDVAFVPDPDRPGALALRVAGTDQSYVVLDDPLHLEFDYVDKIAEALQAWRPVPERIRIVHVGGGALTLPRYVTATRPTSAQIVCEPDAELTALVRTVAPLPPRSGIKVRAVGGREGIAAMADDAIDAIILDAFAGGRVPADLVTEEFITDVVRVLDAGGLFCANIADQAPFAWSRRFVAGVMAHFPQVCAGSLTSTWRGRRYGNIVVVAGERFDAAHLQRRAAGSPFPYRWVGDDALAAWCTGAVPFTAADTVASTPPPQGAGVWFAG